MARILIIGVDGAIGSALAEALVARGDEVVGTTRRERSSGAGMRLRLDLAADDVAQVALPSVNAAVICAAMARYVDCRERPAEARAINVTAPARIARRLAQQGARTVLLSTSAVLDCAAPRMAADRPHAPASAYGALKAEAEDAILGARGAVLRLTKVVTPEMTLLLDWIAALRRGEAIRAFADLTFAPITLEDAVAATLAALADAGGGVLQVSGEDLAYADAARHLAWRLGAPPQLVQAVPAAEHGIPPGEITRFTSLDTTRLTRLTGWMSPKASDVLDRVFGAQLERRSA